jgi:hypothetical protein
MKHLIPPIYAQITNPVLDNQNFVTNPQGYASSVIQTIFSIFFIVGILYFIWHFIMAGYHFIDGLGDPKRIESARDQLTYSFVGLVVIFSVFALLRFAGLVLGITGLQTLSIPWPTL